MPRPSRRLLLLPLLLLVPLGVLKWRADHPPLTKADGELRTIIGQVQEMRIMGRSPLWHRLTGLDDTTFINIKGRATLHEITEVLRLKNVQHLKDRTFLGSLQGGNIYLTSPTDKPQVRRVLMYSRDTESNYLLFVYRQRPGVDRASVHSQFAPRFEALITDLVRRAKAGGKHPGVTLEH